MADHAMTVERNDEQSQQYQRQRGLGEQQDAIFEKAKEFLKSSLAWSLALIQAKDILINMQATFIAIFVALITLFVISPQTTRSNQGMAFISFMFFVLGCLVVGIAIDLIILNSYFKWVVYGMFLAMVATNPDCQQFFQEMKQVFKSMCGTIFLRIKNLFIQSQVIIENLLTINVAYREQSSINNNPVTRPVGDDGGGVGDERTLSR